MSTRILYTGTRAPEPTPEGIALFHAPMLTVEVLSLDPALFMDPANLGVVLYSRHAITALERSDIDLDGATIFCVGEKTGARASRAFPGGNVLVAPEDKQRFEGLAAWMRGISVLPPVILSLGLRGLWPRRSKGGRAARSSKSQRMQPVRPQTSPPSLPSSPGRAPRPSIGSCW